MQNDYPIDIRLTQSLDIQIEKRPVGKVWLRLRQLELVEKLNEIDRKALYGVNHAI